MITDEATVDDFERGQRVELHPGTDPWMMGDRFGVVTWIDFSKGVVRVKLDVSGKSINILLRNIIKRRP